MTIQIFLAMLLACSLFTSLTVEGIKKVTEGMQVKVQLEHCGGCRSNRSGSGNQLRL